MLSCFLCELFVFCRRNRCVLVSMCVSHRAHTNTPFESIRFCSLWCGNLFYRELCLHKWQFKKRLKKTPKRAEKQTLLPHKRSGNRKKKTWQRHQFDVVASRLWTIAQCDTVSPAAAALKPQSVRFDRLSVNNMPCGHISPSSSVTWTKCFSSAILKSKRCWGAIHSRRQIVTTVQETIS